ncbi:MAG: hypothetical protein JWQ81_8145 [Amycolatopsis sp.]|nr:hypothetical protein [Amycolatopsis sp.]
MGTNMDRRKMLTSSGLTIGAVALGAVIGGSTPASADGLTGKPGWGTRDHEEEHLKTFDEFDFVVFSGQKWQRVGESHAKDIKVTWPDAHVTVGIDRHIADLKTLFVWAPDCSIKTHPFRIASGDLTSVVGVMTGTFTKPMPRSDGTVIQPTGKSYSLSMSTVGRWRPDGTMSEEFLFWDDKSFFQQIGLG